MNILLLSWRGLGHPNAGGAEISTHEHAKGWVKMGCKVTLFTSYYKGAKREENIDGVQIIRNGRQFFGVQIEAFKWYLFEDHPKYDLVIDQFHGIPFFTPLFVGVKKLAFIHEVAKEVWMLNPWPKPFYQFPGLIGRLVEPLIFKLFYKSMPFMTVSESTKKDLVEWGIPQSNVTVIYNGINPPRIKILPPKENKKTIIFLGALSKDKGIEDALRIFSEIKKRMPDWQFWVVGKSDSGYLSIIKNLARNLGIINQVKFFGFVSEKKKLELLAKAHILVNPSIREGWGLVVIEAASVGTPTVGYDVAGLRDSIIEGKTGILSAPNVLSNMEAILTLISNNKKYSIMRNNCIKWSGKFNWKISSALSLNLIRKILTN